MRNGATDRMRSSAPRQDRKVRDRARRSEAKAEAVSGSTTEKGAVGVLLSFYRLVAVGSSLKTLPTSSTKPIFPSTAGGWPAPC
jgi:hypothetical protein